MGLMEKLKWLDPFTYVDMALEKINPGHNPLIDWPAYLVSAFVFAWLLYAVIGLFLGTGAPFWIVLSPSMEPVLYRGDIVMLGGANADTIKAQVAVVDFPLEGKSLSDFAQLAYGTSDGGRTEAKKIVFGEDKIFDITKAGDIIIYFSKYRNEPIIHRAVLKIISTDGAYFLTKGDSIHNPTIDQDCGRVVNGVPEHECIALYPVPAKDMQGKMLFKLPLLGYVKLLIFDDLQNIIFGCPRGRTCYFP